MSEPSEISIAAYAPPIVVYPREGQGTSFWQEKLYDQVYVYYSAWVQFRRTLKRNSRTILGEPALRGDFRIRRNSTLG